jgi:hypothetical protein
MADEAKVLTLDLGRGTDAYADSLASLLDKIGSHIAEQSKGRIKPKQGDAAAYLEAVTRSVSQNMEQAVPGMDVRECAVIFGTVLGSELGVYLAKKNIVQGQLYEIVEAIGFALIDTAERVAKQVQ